MAGYVIFPRAIHIVNEIVLSVCLLLREVRQSFSGESFSRSHQASPVRPTRKINTLTYKSIANNWPNKRLQLPNIPHHLVHCATADTNNERVGRVLKSLFRTIGSWKRLLFTAKKDPVRLNGFSRPEPRFFLPKIQFCVYFWNHFPP